jgi:CRP-like cAMP-binding protein
MSVERELGTIERVLALKKLPVFADLHPAELAPLAACAVPRRVPAGAPLPAAGDDGSVHVLLEGRVAEGNEVREAPALLGVLAVLAGERPALVAVEESTTLEIRRAPLLAVLGDEFEVWLATLRHVCARTPRGELFGPHDAGAEVAAVRPAADPADLADRIATLRRFAPLAVLGIHALGEIAGELDELAVARGHVLWECGAATSHVLAITAGVVRCTAPGEPARDVGAGTLLGLTEALCAGRFGHRAEARSAVRALRIDVDGFVDVLEDDPEAGVELLGSIARGALRAAAPGRAATAPQRRGACDGRE